MLFLEKTVFLALIILINNHADTLHHELWDDPMENTSSVSIAFLWNRTEVSSNTRAGGLARLVPRE